MTNNYLDELHSLVPAVITQLTAKKIDPRYLSFGGPGEIPSRKSRPPTDARSEFLANRAMGDWAEKLLSAAIRDALPGLEVSHYGNTENLQAGDPGFGEFYLNVLEEVRIHGKRPDLLIFPSAAGVPRDISLLPLEASNAYLPMAIGAIEVRSSKFKARKYMSVRMEERKGKQGNSVRETPSFTVKVEDLKIIYRWLERARVPQIYAQVFFDDVWAIDVIKIFKIIGSGIGYVIDEPAKSQLKATIMIPITSGVRIGSFSAEPSFQAKTRETRLGRIDAFVVPDGGKIDLILENFRKVLPV